MTAAAASELPRDVVLLATADWNNPFWTNKQHVACQLADRGFRVLYIESLGIRRPSASAHDMARILRRVRSAVAMPERVRDGIHVWAPMVVPLHGITAIRTLNRRALSGMLALQLRRLGFRRPLLWTYNPLTTQLLDTSTFDGIVYHCVDDIAAQPGMPAAAIEAADRELTERADIVFTTSPRLAETHRQWNAGTHFLPNVADYDHFARAMAPETPVPEDLALIPAPRLGFIGAVSGYKVDFELLRHIALERPDWSVVVIGRIGEGDPWTSAAPLHGLPNLHLLGPRSYDRLPAYLKGIDVGLLPNRTNEYTASMFPMKFFEYLAAGRPVVSVALPALEAYRDVACLADTRQEFMQGIERALAGSCATLDARLAVAAENTWDARTARMLELIAAARAGAIAAARTAG